MRRWAPALCASLALHSLLLLAPEASETGRPIPGEFRLVLRAEVQGARVRAPVAAAPEKPEPDRPAPRPPEKRPRQPEPARKAPKPRKLPAPQVEPPGAAAESPAIDVADPAGKDEASAGGRVAKSPGSGRPAGAPGSAGTKAAPVDVATLRILSQPPPEYPLFSRRRKEEGIVRLLLTIRSGRVADASIASGSGSSRLDEAALKAVKKWRFDHPGEVRATASIVFRLN